MFVDVRNEGGGPDPWEPKRQRRRLTKRQEKAMGWLIGVNLLLLLVAPLGGSTLVVALIALMKG